jgi:anti-sigma regulatory factor (Ser/Thr protein kinase)
VRLLLILGVWTWVAFFFATRDYFGRRSFGLEATWTKALWWKGMEWYAWAILSLAVVRVCRRFYDPLNLNWWRYLGIHLVCGTVISTVHVAICSIGALIEAKVLNTGHSWPYLFHLVFVNHFHFDWLVYAGIVSVWHAIDSYRSFRDRELQAVALEGQLARSQLQMLKTQLQPHFLFNTLHGISALNHEDPKAANRMLARLSSLLRLTLEHDSSHEVPLEKELEFLRHYLEIEQVRLGPRLTVKVEIAPNTLDAYVPNLLLQPIVENAIRHAISPFSAPGQIEIMAAREEDCLRLRVTDTGPGLVGKPVRSGVGLTNTQERLRQLYGENGRLELADGEGGGLRVTVSLPFRRDASSTENNRISAEA